MANKNIYSRMQQKHDIQANWEKAVNFIPLEGEIIVYDPDENNLNSRIKIGDGETKVNNLAFIESANHIVSPTAPEDTSAIWVDTDDNSVDDTQFVSYEPQILTEAQQAQARQNIGAISASDLGTNSPLTGKKIVFDGDSIATHVGSYPSLIADKTACIIANQAVGGARLCAVSDKHSVVNNLSNLPTDGDIYCFQGGINDWWANTPVGTYTQGDYTGTVDPTTIYGAMETIFRYALTNFFGKAVCFVITHKIQNAAYSQNTAGHTFWDYRKAMIDVCEKYSIPYYDAFTKSGLNGWHTAQKAGLFTDGDGTHPTEQAYEAFYVPQLISLFESIIPRGNYEAPAKPVTYTNVLKTAVDTSGNPYNSGKGWKEDTYLSWDGKTESSSTNYDATGYIPAKIGDVVRLKNVQLCKTVGTASKCIISYFKSDFSSMSSTNWLKTPADLSEAWQVVTNEAGTDVVQFTIPTALQASLSYIRLCCGSLTDASVITINEEID